jgi:hypothetical protein
MIESRVDGEADVTFSRASDPRPSQNFGSSADRA